MSSRDLIERVRKALGDRYNVITAVGRGGNASIFGAYDRAGQKVAIKVLHPELAVSVAADRFLREIRYASQLDHPHIARLLDSGESDYLLWFAMPYLAGETLRQVLRREARLPVDRATRIACEVLDALAGRPPFSSVSAAAVLDMHQHQKAPDVRSLRRDVPKGISPVLARALAKQREERWQTATEMREGLLPFTQGAE